MKEESLRGDTGKLSLLARGGDGDGADQASVGYMLMSRLIKTDKITYHHMAGESRYVAVAVETARLLSKHEINCGFLIAKVGRTRGLRPRCV